MMRRLYFIAPLCLVVLLDQISKSWCLNHLPVNFPQPYLDHWLYLTLTFNKRGAFSLFAIPNEFFIIINVLLILMLSIFAFRFELPIGFQILIGCVLGGGMGNLLDRLRFGHVIDFLDLRYWPVFNVADSAVSVGITLFIIYSYFHPMENLKKAS